MSLFQSFPLPLVILFSSLAHAGLFPGSQCYDYQEGSTRSGYLQETVPEGQMCGTDIQTCLNGMWMGPILYESCHQMEKNCGDQPHGTIIHGFLEPNAFANMECIPATRLCNDGEWEGPAVLYPSCFKEP